MASLVCSSMNSLLQRPHVGMATPSGIAIAGMLRYCVVRPGPVRGFTDLAPHRTQRRKDCDTDLSTRLPLRPIGVLRLTWLRALSLPMAALPKSAPSPDFSHVLAIG